MDASATVKTRQMAIAGAVLALLVGLVIAGLWWSDPNRKVDAAAQSADARAVTKSYTTPTAVLDPSEVWITRSEAQLADMKKQNDALAAQLAALAKAVKEGKPVDGQAAVDANALPPAPDGKPPADAPREQGAGQAELAGGNLGELPPAPQDNMPANLPPPPPAAGAANPAAMPGMMPAPPGGQADAATPPGILSIDLGADWKNGHDLGAEGDKGKDGETPAAGADDGKPSNHSINTYLPAGSFVKAVLLSGLDAPTGGQAQSNPQPVLLRLVDGGTLPNQFSSRVKSCHMTAAGYGDISSERAYLRLERLSCVMLDGKVVDSPVKGFVSGEDGKAGMRGNLVSKQGQMIAKALVSGVAGGIGSGISEAYSSISTSATTGTTTTVDPSKIAQFGVANGFGKTLEKVADWYLQRANETYPVIEIASGRAVDIVLNEGFDFGDVDILKEAGDGDAAGDE